MLETAALGAGLSWASGLRLYLAVFAAGVLAHFGWLSLPESLKVLSSPWLIGISGTLSIVEFLVDKVPGLDSVWDAIHTFIRIPAGAVLAAGAFGNMDPQMMTVAGLLGGALAGTAHATKAGARAAINTSPEPFSNWAASISEDVTVMGGLFLSFFHPVAFIVLLIAFLLLAIWFLPKIWRGIRSIRAKLQG